MWAFKRSQDQTDVAYDAELACGHRFSVKHEMVYPVQYRWSASTKSHNRIVTLMILPSLVHLWQGRAVKCSFICTIIHIAMLYTNRDPKGSYDWPS